GQPAPREGQLPRLPTETGGPGYFRTFGIPVLRGRGFLASDRDSTPRVVVVSQTAARMLGLGNDPVGRRIRLAGDSADPWRTVVGVAGDIHYRALRAAPPTIFLPARQWFFQGIFAVRTAGPLSALLPAMRQALREALPGATLVRTETMDDLLGGQLSVPHLSASLFSGFGASALVLTALGLFGVVGATVRERTHELGVRAALGATPNRIRGLVVGQALALSATGAVVGVALAFLVMRFLGALLFEIKPLDPLTLLGAGTVLLGTAWIAALIPAHRATRIDPAQALRGP
ncbi:MAG TPA: FtsX-like permease family protein, partial [Gemmatimonadales bacterium]|nr:FtsX-like permease family protein [Gemmatimonadales bacterium]